MNRILAAVLGLCIVAALTIAVPASAHEGHVHKYMGTIVSVRGDRMTIKEVTIKTTDGKQATFTVGDKTEIVRGSARAGASDLSEGARVVVEAEGGKEPMAAKRIRLGTK